MGLQKTDTQMSRYKKVTLDDLSRRSGLSKTTISRVLSGKSHEFRINNETSRLVIETAIEMNYRPDLVAKLRQTRRRITIGLAVPDLKNPYFSDLVSTIVGEAQKQNFLVAVFDTQDSPDIEDACLLKMRAMKVDGILLVPCTTESRPLEKVSTLIPVVQIDRYISGSYLPYVSTNNFKGAYDAVTMLLRYGHRNITVIQGQPDTITNRERVRGCTQAVSDFGAQCSLNIRGHEFTSKNGYVETLLALEQETPPTAIFTLSNTILYGAIRALQEKSLLWPKDISLATFDHSGTLDLLRPAITCVEQPVASIAATALRMLGNRILSDEPAGPSLLLSPTLVKGDSVSLILPSGTAGSGASPRE